MYSEIGYIRTRINDLAVLFGYTLQDIYSYNRDPKLATVRQLIWMDLREGGFTVDIIGKATKRRHSSIVIGLQRIKGLLQIGDNLANDMREKIRIHEET